MMVFNDEGVKYFIINEIFFKLVFILSTSKNGLNYCPTLLFNKSF